MSTKVADESTKLIFRRTNAKVGRHVAVCPENSSMKHLAYGRIILNQTLSSVQFDVDERETGLICLAGEAQIQVAGVTTDLSRYDAIYAPRDSRFEISTDSSVDFAEFSADVAKHYPLQIVRYQEIIKDPGLCFRAGGPTCTRQLHMMLAKNIEAGRLVAGFTYSDPGNWTSWPPHEHSELLEELYVYFDMPAPAFAVQLVYNDTEDPEVAAIVRDGDAVLMPRGYHPNVSVPGHRVGFLWAMAAHEEQKGRLFGVVNVQPGFQDAPSGLEAGRK